MDQDIAATPRSSVEEGFQRAAARSCWNRLPHVFGAVSLRRYLTGGVVTISVLSALPALAQESQPARKTSKDALPGSPRPPGPGLDPEAPAAPPAPGGRAPSFGAPTDRDAWSFRFGGVINAYQSLGFGDRTAETHDGQSSTPLHTPAYTEGKRPFDNAVSLTLNLSYGNAVVGAVVDYTINSTGKEREGQYRTTRGAAANAAYVLITPEALGALRLQAKVGAVNESYAGTGQWGWGLLGPLVAVRGYGEVLTGEYDLSSDLRLFFSHGVLAVPNVPEFFVRGNHASWGETGASTIGHHAHLGLSFRGKYNVKLHAVNVAGTDERTALAPSDPTAVPEGTATRTPGAPDPLAPAGLCRAGQPTETQNPDDATIIEYRCPKPRDGRMDVLAVETHTFLDQWGQLGISAAYYNLVTAVSVHDGIWWGIDWTLGSNEMINKYIGRYSGGTGEVAVISAQYDLSLASVLWHPEQFDGRGPDLRLAIAGLYHWTLDSAEEVAVGAEGYQVGLDVEYRMLPWLSSTLRVFGTTREGYAVLQADANQGQNLAFVGQAFGLSRVFTVTPGLIFRSDWQAPERLEIAYTRHLYNDFVDNNPARPLDTDVVTIGGAISF